MTKILTGSDKSCIRNCKARIFSHSKTYFSEYGMSQMMKIFDLVPNQDFLPFTLHICKPDFWFRQEDEYAVMTFWSFLSGFGGNLGLFLGGSIISISYFIFCNLHQYLNKLHIETIIMQTINVNQ